jgi:hypothetical protein
MLARSFDEGGRSGDAVPEMKYSLTFRGGLAANQTPNCQQCLESIHICQIEHCQEIR